VNRKPAKENRSGERPGDQLPWMPIIVSSNASQAKLLKSFLDAEFSVTSCCHADLPLQTVIDQSDDQACFYLLDCDQAGGGAIEKRLYLDASIQTPNHIKIALYNVDREDHLAPLVKRFKIRGIFYRHDSQAMLVKGLRTILSGRLWLTRKMLSDCVRLVNEKRIEPSAAGLKQLSSREKEILQHVVFGESNQEIADAMQISVHTVKTHLYNAYKKINVPNRLQGTLWAATYLRDHSDD
jgi:LuxR family transcriptional regulator of csgAB operon